VCFKGKKSPPPTPTPPGMINTTMNNSFGLNLAKELISCVFSFIDTYCLLNDVALVCKEWYGYVHTQQTWEDREILLDTLPTKDVVPHSAMQLFQKCRVTHFKLSDCRWLFPLLVQQKNVVEGLVIAAYQHPANLERDKLRRILFSNLKKIKFFWTLVPSPDDIDAEELLIIFLQVCPNLTDLEFDFTPVNYSSIQNHILNLKYLRHLSLAEGDITENFLLKLFTSGQKLDSLAVSYCTQWSHDLWLKLSQLPNFKALKKLEFRDKAYYDKNDQDNNTNIKYAFAQNSIEQLSLSRSVACKDSILQSCLKQLTSLSLVNIKNIDISNLGTMHLKKLEMLNIASMNVAFAFLKASSHSLKEFIALNIMDDTENYMEPLEFPNLTLLQIKDSVLDLIGIFRSTGAEMDKIQLSLLASAPELEEFKPKFSYLCRNWVQLRSFDGPLLMFYLLPESVLPTISIMNITPAWNRLDDPILDEGAFQKILLCTSLRELSIAEHEIRVENVLARTLQALPHIKSFIAETCYLTLDQKVSGILNRQSRLLSLHIDMTALRLEDWDCLFKNMSHMKSIGSRHYLDFHIFSNQLRLISRKAILTNLFAGVCGSNSTCHYLHTKVSYISLSLDGSQMNFEDMLLICICTTTESYLDDYGYIGFDIQNFVSNGREKLRQRTLKLIPRVIQRIVGIDNRKRRQLLQLYSKVLTYNLHLLIEAIP
jgi:hypothetical protein